MHVQQNLESLKGHLKTWCKNFAAKTGFEVAAASIDKGPPRMAYLEIRGFHKTVELEMLEGATLKILQLDVEPPTPPSTSSSVVNAPPSDDASKKRTAEEAAAGSSSNSKVARTIEDQLKDE